MNGPCVWDIKVVTCSFCCAGLAADNLVFEDPVMEGVGPDIWLDYLQVKPLGALHPHRNQGVSRYEILPSRPSNCAWEAIVVGADLFPLTLSRLL